MISAADIVRKLAAQDPCAGDVESELETCGLCHVYGYGIASEEHESDCPWRLAVEWVRQSPRVIL